MEMFLFSVRDEKSGLYSPPFVAATQGMAERFIMEEMKKGNLWSSYPDDFVLVEVGQWCDSEGELISTERRQVGTLTRYKEMRDAG